MFPNRGGAGCTDTSNDPWEFFDENSTIDICFTGPGPDYDRDLVMQAVNATFLCLPTDTSRW